ncbi:P-loop containing nucleoside triphosphate hydrolase protein [Hyaloraphidium curvatum]|nr:P-loop containing nucleoside triphosphate hydrolase protein [Hyaloraphidium curvatum]
MQRTDSGASFNAEPIGPAAGSSRLSIATGSPRTGTSLPRPTSSSAVRSVAPSSISSTSGARKSALPLSPSSPSPSSGESSSTLSTGSSALRSPMLQRKVAASESAGSQPSPTAGSTLSRNQSFANPTALAAASLSQAAKDDNCNVTVRIRPPNFAEVADKLVWTVDGEQKIRLDPVFADLNRRSHSEYVYDSVLQGSDNEEAYARSVKNMIPYLMEGYHVTVFAYGQTASGKTYTMTGMDDQPGIIPQAVDDVFEYIRLQRNDAKEYLVRVSYLEIYNEQIRDLLQPDFTDLRILEDKRRGVYVSPLKEEIVTSAKQVLQVIQRGEINRHTSTTDYNEYSSRSHTIFQMVIESREQNTPQSSTKSSPLLPSHGASAKADGTVRVSQLNLIDLAGSEKAATDADRRKEGAYINKSLLTLGTVISRLTEAPKVAASGASSTALAALGHIPYRDSKLTRILQSSLSGNAKISVICTVSPTASSFEESNNTLKFAARVKHVVLNAKANRILDDKALIQKYRNEIAELRHKLAIIETMKDNELKLEKRRFERQIVEEQMIRTTLKERIDHLQKMILTSSGMQARTLLENGAPFGTSASSINPQAALTRKPSVSEMAAEVETFQKVLDLKHTIADRDSVISNLQREVDGLRTLVQRMSAVVQAARQGDLPTAQAFAVQLGTIDVPMADLDGRLPDGKDAGEVITVPRKEYDAHLADSAIKDQKLVELASRLAGFQERSKSLESLLAHREEMLAQRTLEMKALQERMDPLLSSSSALSPAADGPGPSLRLTSSSILAQESQLHHNRMMLDGLMSSFARLAVPSEGSLAGVEVSGDDPESYEDDETF